MTSSTDTTATVYRPTLDCDLTGCTAPIAVHVLADGRAIAIYDSETDALYDSLDDLVAEHATGPMSRDELKAELLGAEHGEVVYTAEELDEAVEAHASNYGEVPTRWVADPLADPLADLDPEAAEEVAGEWVVVGPEWGVDVTDDEYDAACQRATDWCTAHEGPRLSIEFRRAQAGEAAGTYQRLRNGNLQIHGYTLPVPDVIRELTNRASEHACETWPIEPETRTYTLRDDDGYTTEVEATDDAHARELAKAWVRGGDWNVDDVSIHVDVEITDDDGDSETITVQLDPEAPACTEDEHDWQSPHPLVGGIESNPGVVGSDHGGVRITEVCSHCGCYRVRDTGYTRPDNGRRAEAINYREADSDSREWIESLLNTYAIVDAEPGYVGRARVLEVCTDRRGAGDASLVAEMTSRAGLGGAWVYVDGPCDVGDLLEIDEDGNATVID